MSSERYLCFTNATNTFWNLIMTGLADVDGFKICVQVCVWPDLRPLAAGRSNLKLQNRLTFRGMTALLMICMDEICSSWFDFIHNDWKRVSFYVLHFLIWTLREAEHGKLNWCFVLAQIVYYWRSSFHTVSVELVKYGTRFIWAKSSPDWCWEDRTCYDQEFGELIRWNIMC